MLNIMQCAYTYMKYELMLLFIIKRRPLAVFFSVSNSPLFATAVAFFLSLNEFKLKIMGFVHRRKKCICFLSMYLCRPIALTIRLS